MPDRGVATEPGEERQIPRLEEVDRLADATEPRYGAMALLAAFAGLRKGEFLRLACRHADLASEPPTVPIERARPETTQGLIFQDAKTDAGVPTLALLAPVADELAGHLGRWVGDDPDALVFTAEYSGDSPNKTVWRRVWGRARASVGRPVVS